MAGKATQAAKLRLFVKKKNHKCSFRHSIHFSSPAQKWTILQSKTMAAALIFPLEKPLFKQQITLNRKSTGYIINIL